MMADAEAILSWRNQDDVLANCGSTEIVRKPQHIMWMKDHICQLYIAVVGSDLIGCGRIHEHPLDVSLQLRSICQISYMIGSQYRGQGYGKELATLLVKRAKELGFTTIAARIRRGNDRSLMAAMVAGVDSVEFFR